MERPILTSRALASLACGALAAGGLAGCLRSTAFPCTEDADCTGGAPGRCEPVGYCSFPDPGCATGQRFGEHSGPYAGQCTTGADAGVDAPSACPPSYAALDGAGPHVYRAIAAPASWTAQRAACTADGGYLAEPDSAAELAAVTALADAPADIWVGVTDQAAEGMFVTGRGAPAVFLPWSAGEPDDEPGLADCVRASRAGTYADDRCATARAAVCECEP